MSFSHAAATKTSEPEKELLIALGCLREQARMESFEIGQDIIDGWETSFQQFQVFAKQIQRFVAYQAWVESHAENHCLAQTVVSWAGDVKTVFGNNVLQDQMTRHGRTLALALESRDILIQSLVMAIQGGIKISVVLVIPGGAFWGTPLAWRFICRALNDATPVEKN
jgi:hypothetical protein